MCVEAVRQFFHGLGPIDGFLDVAAFSYEKGGTPNTNRTCDLPLRRGLLYPLSYRGVASILPEAAIAPEFQGLAVAFSRFTQRLL